MKRDGGKIFFKTWVNEYLGIIILYIPFIFEKSGRLDTTQRENYVIEMKKEPREKE